MSWHWMYVRANEIGRERIAEAARERLVRPRRVPGRRRANGVFAGLAGGVAGFIAGKA